MGPIEFALIWLAIRWSLVVVALCAAIVLQIRLWRKKIKAEDRMLQVINLLTAPLAVVFVVAFAGALGIIGVPKDIISQNLLLASIPGSLICAISALHMTQIAKHSASTATLATN